MVRDLGGHYIIKIDAGGFRALLRIIINLIFIDRNRTTGPIFDRLAISTKDVDSNKRNELNIMAAEKTFSINEISELIEVSPRTIRKVLRANSEKENQPGRGARWMIRESQIEKLREKVNAFNARAAVVADLSD
jgi:hypothetical protein